MRIGAIFIPSHPAHLALGLLIWISWFGTVYGGVSLACRFAAPGAAQGAWTWINVAVALLTLAAMALLLWGAWHCWHGRRTVEEPVQARRFIASVSAGLYLLAAAATLAVGAPTALLPPCLQ